MGHGVQGGDLKEEEEVQVLRPPNTGRREILPILWKTTEMRLRKNNGVGYYTKLSKPHTQERSLPRIYFSDHLNSLLKLQKTAKN